MPQMPGHPPTSPPGDVDIPLSNDLGAPAQARRGARAVLVDWRLPALADNVCLAVSELVTNAVKYGRPPVALRLRRHGQRVRIDVQDRNPTEPGLPPTSAHDGSPSGRGLAIVAALADRMGCEQVPDHGKIVYAEFSDQDPGTR